MPGSPERLLLERFLGGRVANSVGRGRAYLLQVYCRSVGAPGGSSPYRSSPRELALRLQLVLSLSTHRGEDPDHPSVTLSCRDDRDIPSEPP